MGGTEDNQVSQFHLVLSQAAVVTREGWRIEFNAVGEAPQISHNGLSFTLADGVMVPQHVANDRKVDGAPAVVLHRLNETDIGQMIQTDNVQKGILLAPAFCHVSRYAQRLGPKLDIFTTERDTRHLTTDRTGDLATYNEDIQRIENLDIYGHKGILLRNDAEIYNAAINHPEQLANWHMPVRALVEGSDVDRCRRQCRESNQHNMYNCKKTGLLAGSFTTVGGTSDACHYWTASECSGPRSFVVVKCFAGHGDLSYQHKEGAYFSSRPVRAEIRPS